MTLRKLFTSRDTRNAANARAALRDASDDVRETLHALDVELAREHNERLTSRVAVLVRTVHAALVKALRLVHTTHKREDK